MGRILAYLSLDTVGVVSRRIMEGIKITEDRPYMLEDEETSWVHVEEGKRWFYNTETDAVELRQD